MKSLPRIIAFSCAFVAACVNAPNIANAGDTANILAIRDKAGTPVVTGQWHAGFTEVKNYADANGLPLIAVWSNGDKCSHCRKLERCVYQPVFREWMKDSGIVFYFGCSSDSSQDDKYGGNAYMWCWHNKSLKLFPFVKFYWNAKKGTRLADGSVLPTDRVLVEEAIIGDQFDNSKDNADGAQYAINYAKKVFAQYVPAASEEVAPEPSEETEPTPAPSPVLPCRCCTCPADCACRKID